MACRNLSVPMILRIKGKIQRDPEMFVWIGAAPSGEEFSLFVQDIVKRLPGRVDYDTVYDSLTYLAGQEINDRNLDIAIWRLLGNMQRLGREQMVYPWSAQERDEWIPVQIMAIERQLSRRGDPGGDFVLQALAGSCCPMLLRKFWTRKFAAILARRLGFTAPWHAYPFRDIMELVNCRFHVFVEQRLSGKTPGFEEVHVSKPQVTYNRQILRRRLRPAGRFDCPYDFPLSHACWQCHVGLDECLAAVHSRTYVQRYCPACDQPDAWFNPAHSERAICEDCYYQHLLKRRAEE